MIREQRSLARASMALLAATAFAACGDSTGVQDPAAVALNFQVTTGTSTQAATGPALSSSSATTSGPMAVAGPPLVLEGTNGTLTLEEIRLIVAEVELEGDDDACEDDAIDSDDCAEFEAPPRLLDLPLDGSPVTAFVGMIPPNTYDELEFEIEDLEDDEEDGEFAAEVAALREDILVEFPDWPRKGTARVVGTFENTDGEVMSFVVYIEAEIEIERELVPPLVIGEGEANPDLNVDLRPDIWFGGSDGTVLPLHQWDYETTGQVLEFELEMEEGITEIEIGDD